MSEPINWVKKDLDDIMFERLWERMYRGFGNRIRPLKSFTKKEKAIIFLDVFEFPTVKDGRPKSKQGNLITAFQRFLKPEVDENKVWLKGFKG